MIADIDGSGLQLRGLENCDDLIRFFVRRQELTLLVARLEKIEEQNTFDLALASMGDLSKQRSRVIEQIVGARVSGIPDAIVKVTILSSLIADGELQVGLTSQCLKECARALAVEDEPEQCLRALEPDLWTACQEVRDAMCEASSDTEAFPDSQWRALGERVREIARCEAMTAVGLKAKGEIFQEVFQFASTTEGLRALQMSYMQDFRFLLSG